LFQMMGPQGGLGQGNQDAISNLRQLMNPSSAAINDFAQPYMDTFNQQTVPGLAERFAGAGALGGGLSSSGFGQSLSAAGGNLQSQLAQLKSKLGLEAGNSLMNMFGNMAGQGLNAKPFGYQHTQGGPSAMQQGLSTWGQNGYPGAQQGWEGLMNLFSSGNSAGGSQQISSHMPAWGG